MEELPKSWRASELDNLLIFILGGDWGKALDIDDPDYVEVKCIRASEIKNWDTEKGLTAANRKIKKNSLLSRELRENDIIVEISGGGPEQPVGRTVLIDKTVLSQNSEHPKVCTNFFRLIRPTKEINSTYLNYFLQHFYKSGEVRKCQGGSNNLRNLKFHDYIQTTIPISPFNEQKRIVAKIETLFSELDKGIESLKTAREQLKVYRQAVLKHAFEGKLTADWREENGLKIENWRSVCVKDIANVGTGATPKRGQKKYYENGIYPWVTSGALNSDYVRECTEFITELALKETNCKLYKPGTILVAMYGEGKTRGKTSILQIEAATNQACAAITITEENILRSFLWNFFKYSYENIRLRSSGGVQPNLNLSHIKNIEFPFPTLEEQKVINEEIESQLFQTNKLQDEIGLNLQKIEALRQSILKKAFTGKLVSQDPNDEPASELLARIKMEKQKI